MRILMLNYEFPPLGGGASPISYEIAKQLSKIGDLKIDLITMGFKDLPSEEKLNDNLTIHRVRCLRTKKEICHPWEQLTYLFAGYKKAKELLKKNDYAICYSHFIIPTGALAWKLKRKFNLPYVITSHGSDVLGYNPRFKLLYPLLIRKWRKIVKNAMFITTPSRFLGEKIIEILPEVTNKIKVIHNGIDQNKFLAHPKENRILMVARLLDYKGVQDVIKALTLIKLKTWEVDIVGEGPLKEELIEQVKRSNLDDKVFFHGWVDNKSVEMKNLYGKASIFISASYFENLSVVLLEALSAGCHVLASDVGGNPEVIKEDNLFPAKNSKALALKLKKLINSLEIKQGVVPNKFHWEGIITQYSDLLRIEHEGKEN